MLRHVGRHSLSLFPNVPTCGRILGTCSDAAVLEGETFLFLYKEKTKTKTKKSSFIIRDQPTCSTLLLLHKNIFASATNSDVRVTEPINAVSAVKTMH